MKKNLKKEIRDKTAKARKEIRDKTAKARKGIKTNPILAIIIAAFIMFFIYFSFLSPMAQCKRAFKKLAPKTESNVLTIICQKELKNK